MKNLDLPKTNNIALWDNIVDKKNLLTRAKIKGYREQVIERYKFYETHYESLDCISPLSESTWSPIKEELISLFGNNVSFKEVKKDLLNVARCPYCTLNRPNTLDHYFDKSTYPEYSVFVPNLVPCCSECNSIKGVSVFNDKNHRQFIHFYLDTLPNYQFLFVRFKMQPNEKIPTIKIWLQLNKNDVLKEQIEEHFKKLNLINKYEDAIAEKISTVINAFNRGREQGNTVTNMRHVLETCYLSYVDSYGHNFWETCMYEGVLHSEGFVEAFFER